MPANPDHLRPPPSPPARDRRRGSGRTNSCSSPENAAPTIAEDFSYIENAFPATRALIALVGRMHREPVRSRARSVANLEFYRARLGGLPQAGCRSGRARPHGHYRNLIHLRYGSFVLLGTVLVAADVDEFSRPLDFNPRLEGKLCVAASPVGAIKADGSFDFSACFTHNYQQFMGEFVNWVEDVAESRSARDYRGPVSYAETVTRWQSLSYRPEYNAAYCIAVCPAGEDVVGLYRSDKRAHLDDGVRPLQQRAEPVYVAKGSDAADHVARRFPHKRVRWVRPGARATSIANFPAGMPLSFQAGKAAGLDATDRFTFTGSETTRAAVVIRDARLKVTEGHGGTPDLRAVADAETWLRFLRHEVSIVRCLLTRAVRLKGVPQLLVAFAGVSRLEGWLGTGRAKVLRVSVWPETSNSKPAPVTF